MGQGRCLLRSKLCGQSTARQMKGSGKAAGDGHPWEVLLWLQGVGHGGGRGRGMEVTRQNWSARAIVRGRVRGRQCVVGDSGVGQDSKISVGAERVRIKDKRRGRVGKGAGQAQHMRRLADPAWGALH